VWKSCMIRRADFLYQFRRHGLRHWQQSAWRYYRVWLW
jgi:hypothetical protein